MIRALALAFLLATTTAAVVAKDDIPTNKRDCLALSQTLYRKAERLERRTKQMIPREFVRVAATLDLFCEEEDFEKARIHIDLDEDMPKELHKIRQARVLL